MAEFQVLFHNPDSLSDRDLSAVKNKIRLHKLTMLATGAGAAGAGFLLTKKPSYLAGLFIIGYAAGNPVGKLLNNMRWSLQQPLDSEIATAFETRYMNKSLNLCGYGNNSVTAAGNIQENNARYKKPY